MSIFILYTAGSDTIEYFRRLYTQTVDLIIIYGLNLSTVWLADWESHPGECASDELRSRSDSPEVPESFKDKLCKRLSPYRSGSFYHC